VAAVCETAWARSAVESVKEALGVKALGVSKALGVRAHLVISEGSNTFRMGSA